MFSLDKREKNLLFQESSFTYFYIHGSTERAISEGKETCFECFWFCWFYLIRGYDGKRWESGIQAKRLGVELRTGHGYDSSASTLTPPSLSSSSLLLESGGLCFVHAPGPRLLCAGLSKRKNSWRTGFSRPVHYAVFSTRVIALDIHWMAELWKTVTNKRSSRSYIHQFLSFWLRKVLLEVQQSGLHKGLKGQPCYENRF